jgi:hypothetical protein
MKEFIIAIIIAAVAAFIAGFSLKKEKVIYVDVPYMVTDTTYVEVEKIIYVHLPAKHDTVIIADTLLVQEPFEIAMFDTTLSNGKQLYGQLAVQYYPRPVDWFNVEFQPAPLPTITITKYITEKHKWYAHPAFTFVAGFSAGVLVLK